MESLEDVLDTAELLQKIEGTEEVAKMDALLSLAITGGDYGGFNWFNLLTEATSRSLKRAIDKASCSGSHT